MSDPDRPLERGSFDTPAFAEDIAVSGNLALLAEDFGLRIIDVSNPSNPVPRGFFPLPIRNGRPDRAVAVSGNLAYVADDVAGLRIIDVRDPTRPVERGSFDTPGVLLDVAVSGNLAYVADGMGGFRIIDVTNPSHPFERGAFAMLDAASIAISGTLAVVVGDNNLRILDVSNPNSPIERGFFRTPFNPDGVAVSGNLLLVANGVAGLFILRYTGP